MKSIIRIADEWLSEFQTTKSSLISMLASWFLKIVAPHGINKWSIPIRELQIWLSQQCLFSLWILHCWIRCNMGDTIVHQDRRLCYWIVENKFKLPLNSFGDHRQKSSCGDWYHSLQHTNPTLWGGWWIVSLREGN